MGQALEKADVAALRALRTVGHTPAAERVVRRFSLLGEHAAVWLAIGGVGYALDPPRRERWKRAAKSVALAYLVNTGLKVVVRRRRPQLAGLPPLTGTPTGLSFPSAHATASFAGARAYSALAPAGPLYALATALALSRLYLGVHYPSDSLAGAALGTIVGSAGR
jgi:hypothetical protein